MEEDNKDVKKPALKENVAAALSYLLFWITGILFLFLEKDNRFVRFHAMQSVITFGLFTLFFILSSIVDRIVIATSAWEYRGVFIFLNIFDLINAAVSLLFFLVWIFLIVKALQNEKVKLPFIGEVVDSLV